MLAEITRHSRFTVEEFHTLATDEPIDVPGLHRRIRTMIENAASFIAKILSRAVGVIFLDGQKAVQPDISASTSISGTRVPPRAFGRYPPRFRGRCWNATAKQSEAKDKSSQPTTPRKNMRVNEQLRALY